VRRDSCVDFGAIGPINYLFVFSSFFTFFFRYAFFLSCFTSLLVYFLTDLSSLITE